jgi:hypothetical protein
LRLPQIIGNDFCDARSRRKLKLRGRIRALFDAGMSRRMENGDAPPHSKTGKMRLQMAFPNRPEYGQN